jgi:hypothetical protein
MDPSLLAAAAGALAVVGSWVLYLATVPSGRVPARPVGHMVVQGLGTTAALSSLWLAVPGGFMAVIMAISVASPALIMGPLFFFLLSQRKTPIGRLTVRVGDRLPEFSAVDSSGAPFRSPQLAGQRILLKFFRGHW